MTKIIGILNLTMDSFSDGGMYYDFTSAKKHISEMIEQGTDVIDIGAESTRSGFSDVDEDSQIRTLTRSEERRVGKECRSRWSPYH